MANPRKFRPLEYVMESQMSCDICMGTGWGDLEGHPCGCPVSGYDPDPDFAKLFDLYLYLVSDIAEDGTAEDDDVQVGTRAVVIVNYVHEAGESYQVSVEFGTVDECKRLLDAHSARLLKEHQCHLFRLPDRVQRDGVLIITYHLGAEIYEVHMYDDTTPNYASFKLNPRPDPLDVFYASGHYHACNCDLGYGECIECLREQGRITNDQRA
jgi:hypothetical protein